MSETKQKTNYQHTPFPQQLVIETTAGCNQRCIFCGRTYMERPKKTMERDIFDKIVEEVAAENPYTEIWPTFMGEGLLLGDRLFDMIRYAKKVGCEKITLNTNGTPINERTIPGIIECGIDRLIISCDAHTPETHAIVRPAISPRSTGGLIEIYRGVQLLIETMRKQDLRKPMIEMQFSIFDENEHEAGDYRKFWLDQGVIVKVRPKLYWSGLVPNGDHRVTYQNRTPCLWSLETSGIHWNGNVVICVCDCEGKYVAGNIEMQTLKEIWNGPLKWIRELHMRHRFRELPEICRTCPDWEVKKAHCYYPDDQSKQEYEEYLTKGRAFMEKHFWHEDKNPLK